MRALDTLSDFRRENPSLAMSLILVALQQIMHQPLVAFRY